MRVATLRFDVDCPVAIERIHEGWQYQLGGIGAGESTVAIWRPLHRCTHAVAIAKMDVVPHCNLVTIINDWRAGHRQKKAVHQFDAAPVALEQRCKAPADA